MQSLSFLGRDVVVAQGPIPPYPPPLFPEEAACIAQAALKRRHEFATGRWYARHALAHLGVPATPLLPGPDRAPRWPAGIVGSITHSDTLCIAAVARQDRVHALGVDAEPWAPLDAELWPLVCTPGELGWLTRQPPRLRGYLARALFSAKEAAYKCQYPLTGAMLDFLDLEIALDLPGGRFSTMLRKAAGPCLPAGTTLHGALCFQAGHVLTGLALRPADLAAARPAG